MNGLREVRRNKLEKTNCNEDWQTKGWARYRERWRSDCLNELITWPKKLLANLWTENSLEKYRRCNSSERSPELPVIMRWLLSRHRDAMSNLNANPTASDVACTVELTNHVRLKQCAFHQVRKQLRGQAKCAFQSWSLVVGPKRSTALSFGHPLPNIPQCHQVIMQRT
jgi:hypothetical protein